MPADERWTIRVPGPPDAAALTRVHVTSWREAYGQLLPSRFWDEAEYERRLVRWQARLGDEVVRARLRVAEQDGRLLGFGFAGPTHSALVRRETELYGLYVLAQVYGRGVGAALLDEVVGDSPAQLWVARDNPRARAFYRKHGFLESGDEKVDDDLDGLAEVLHVR